MNGEITIHRPQRHGSDIILSATLKHGLRSWTRHLWVHGTACGPDSRGRLLHVAARSGEPAQLRANEGAP